MVYCSDSGHAGLGDKFSVAIPLPHPPPFLEVRVKDLALAPPLLAACAGYERGTWRSEQLAGHLMEWLPEFALRHSELEALRHDTAVRSLLRAARTVFETDKYMRRGEFGELLLHVLLRQEYGTLPAISKLFYKDAPNDTVKGFDAVHVVAVDAGLELWLGEAKFYTDISAAIRDVVAELERHTRTSYLRTEFAAIVNKIDPTWPHADRLRLLLDPGTSLDAVFRCARIPVLLTYDSTCLGSHDCVCDAFRSAFEDEVRKHHQTFTEALQGRLPAELTVNLFLLPMNTKQALVEALHAKLKAWQQTA